MTLAELKKIAAQFFPMILIEHLFPYKFRATVRIFLFVFSFLTLVLVFLHIVFLDQLHVLPKFLSFLEIHGFRIRALCVFSILIWVMFQLLEVMYVSYYFKEKQMDVELARVILGDEHEKYDEDLTQGLMRSAIGHLLMIRLGFSDGDIEAFIKSDRQVLDSIRFKLSKVEVDGYIGFYDYAEAIFVQDADFRNFLNRREITNEIFFGAARFVDQNQKRLHERSRWWSRDYLARIPSIGRNWSYGQVYLLEKFGHGIIYEESFRNLGEKWRLYQKEAIALEQILVKDRSANIMLVTKETQAGMQIVSSLARMIIDGSTLSDLQEKRLFVLDGMTLVDSMKEKTAFETQLRGILAQAAYAGNIIIVIPHFDRLLQNARAINADVSTIFTEALSATDLHILALTEPRRFHTEIEPDHDLMQYFERSFVENIDIRRLLELIQDEALLIEGHHQIVFTYPALLAVVEGAQRYFSNESVLHRAVDILHDLTPMLVTQKRFFVQRRDVVELLREKTGIPQGHVAAEEQERLTNLETDLHKRIVGQDDAIVALSAALRRARAGVTNPKRPLGSFLFLGPTGVGKTETTKALADIFFRNEDQIMRFDMSEYTGVDAIDKLIGSKNGQIGILTTRLREKQYGVLLLDEFEKASGDVHNLFLQILDEGFFSDGLGERVNARNVIIIATSNAGSDLIYQATADGGTVLDKKQEIVNAIIENRIFKPELINRFDDVIMFHALRESHLRQIAEFQIQKLNDRLHGKSITVESTPWLIDFLVAKGSNPQFGAREMNRAIQDSIETMIAGKIIDGSVVPGDTLAFVQHSGEEGKLHLVRR